jgi:hypothetical protein
VGVVGLTPPNSRRDVFFLLSGSPRAD